MNTTTRRATRKDLPAMKHYTLAGLLALCLAVPAARAGDSSDVALAKLESPDGAWVV